MKQSCPEQQPVVIAADFMALFDRCLASGLKARLIFSHAAGHQVLTVTCNLPAPAVNLAAAGKRRRRHRRRHRRRQRRGRAAKASARVSTPPTATPAAPTPAAPSPALGPCPLLPETAPPPAKRTRKRRNKVELLRDWDESSEFLFSPLPSRSTSPSPTPLPANLRSQPTPPPNSPQPAPRDSPTLEPVSPLLELPAPPVLPNSPPISLTPSLPASPQNVAPPVNVAPPAADTATTATSPPPSSLRLQTPASPPPFLLLLLCHPTYLLVFLKSFVDTFSKMTMIYVTDNVLDVIRKNERTKIPYVYVVVRKYSILEISPQTFIFKISSNSLKTNVLFYKDNLLV